MEERIRLLQEITDAHGISGFEGDVRRVIRKHMAGIADISVDNLGSIICKKTGSAATPKVMLPGHMDEIGFMVSYLTEEGFIKFVPIGGWWDQTMLAQRVIVKGRKGDVPGVIGSKPPHILTQDERDKVVKKDDMFIDVGASSREELEDVFGVRPGDPIIPDSKFQVMRNEKLLMAKAFDNRLGCALFIDVIRELKEQDHPNTLYGVGTVQEEVGLRGARTSAHAIEPDVCIALEVGIAGDMPGVKEDKAPPKLGKGPILLVADHSMIAHRGLRDLCIDTADEIGISLQYATMMGGGTDAGAVHTFGRGVPSIVLAVPTRYIHTHSSIINVEDYEKTVKLIVALVQKLDEKTVSALREP